MKDLKLLDQASEHVHRQYRPAGLHHLVTELVDNCIDEIGAGYLGTQINVQLHTDGSVRPSGPAGLVTMTTGRGIPN